MAKVFFSYSHDDEIYRDQLEKHLSLLKRQNLIEAWHDRRILAGSMVDDSISDELETANIILLLVSASFIASDYCYSKEMTRALERHECGDAVVIPVILRPCDWHQAPFGELMATPRDGLAITKWTNHDEAYTDIARAIRKVVESHSQATNTAPVAPSFRVLTTAPVERARSSNLRLKKNFTDQDRDEFMMEGFEYIHHFFEASLVELAERNTDVQGVCRLMDANTLTAMVYRNGKKATECSIRLGALGLRSGGLSFSWDASAQRNSANEMLLIETDDQSIFFKSVGMSSGGAKTRLSHEGAAEFFWTLLISPLQ
jgi:hypothetical protein